MNRYQHEVAEMDRRHRLVVRALSFAGAAGLVALALWSADLPSTGWWMSAQAWWDGQEKREGASWPAESSAPKQTLASAAPDSAPIAVVHPGTDSTISETPQPLYLVATSMGRNKNEGTAQIGTNPDNPQTYVGDAILANGARLAEIHNDHVVLELSGQRLELYSVKAGNASRDGGPAALALVGGATKPAAKVKFAEDRLSEIVRSMPFYENDSFAGLQVFPGRKSSVFSQLGLQSGDVIVAADGAAIVDSASVAEALRVLTDGAGMTVSVRRGNTVESLSLDGSIVFDAVAIQPSPEQQQAMAVPPPM